MLRGTSETSPLYNLSTVGGWSSQRYPHNGSLYKQTPVLSIGEGRVKVNKVNCSWGSLEHLPIFYGNCIAIKVTEQYYVSLHNLS